MEDDIINKIYNRVINVILKDSSQENSKELSDSYRQYLINTYGDIDEQVINLEDVFNTIVEVELDKWKNVSILKKYSEFLRDDALKNIEQISLVGQRYALNRLRQKNILSISENEANQNIEMLENLRPNVRDFNKTLADYYISEGTIDFEYACGKTNNYSLRVGRIK